MYKLHVVYAGFGDAFIFEDSAAQSEQKGDDKRIYLIDGGPCGPTPIAAGGAPYSSYYYAALERAACNKSQPIFPRVNAMFISHDHQDHYGGFLKIIKKYLEKTYTDKGSVAFPLVFNGPLYAAQVSAEQKIKEESDKEEMLKKKLEREAEEEAEELEEVQNLITTVDPTFASNALVSNKTGAAKSSKTATELGTVPDKLKNEYAFEKQEAKLNVDNFIISAPDSFNICERQPKRSVAHAFSAKSSLPRVLTPDTSKANRSSLLMYHASARVLFTGDNTGNNIIDFFKEKNIGPLSLFKVPHHGSLRNSQYIPEEKEVKMVDSDVSYDGAALAIKLYGLLCLIKYAQVAELKDVESLLDEELKLYTKIVNNLANKVTALVTTMIDATKKVLEEYKKIGDALINKDFIDEYANVSGKVNGSLNQLKTKTGAEVEEIRGINSFVTTQLASLALKFKTDKAAKNFSKQLNLLLNARTNINAEFDKFYNKINPTLHKYSVMNSCLEAIKNILVKKPISTIEIQKFLATHKNLEANYAILTNQGIKDNIGKELEKKINDIWKELKDELKLDNTYNKIVDRYFGKEAPYTFILFSPYYQRYKVVKYIENFYTRVNAENYLISANGTHGHPSPYVIAGIAKGVENNNKIKGTNKKATLYLTDAACIDLEASNEAAKFYGISDVLNALTIKYATHPFFTLSFPTSQGNEVAAEPAEFVREVEANSKLPIKALSTSLNKKGQIILAGLKSQKKYIIKMKKMDGIAGPDEMYLGISEDGLGLRPNAEKEEDAIRFEINSDFTSVNNLYRFQLYSDLASVPFLCKMFLAQDGNWHFAYRVSLEDNFIPLINYTFESIVPKSVVHPLSLAASPSLTPVLTALDLAESFQEEGGAFAANIPTVVEHYIHQLDPNSTWVGPYTLGDILPIMIDSVDETAKLLYQLPTAFVLPETGLQSCNIREDKDSKTAIKTITTPFSTVEVKEATLELKFNNTDPINKMLSKLFGQAPLEKVVPCLKIKNPRAIDREICLNLEISFNNITFTGTFILNAQEKQLQLTLTSKEHLNTLLGLDANSSIDSAFNSHIAKQNNALGGKQPVEEKLATPEKPPLAIGIVVTQPVQGYDSYHLKSGFLQFDAGDLKAAITTFLPKALSDHLTDYVPENMLAKVSLFDPTVPALRRMGFAIDFIFPLAKSIAASGEEQQEDIQAKATLSAFPLANIDGNNWRYAYRLALASVDISAPLTLSNLIATFFSLLKLPDITALPVLKNITDTIGLNELRIEIEERDVGATNQLDVDLSITTLEDIPLWPNVITLTAGTDITCEYSNGIWNGAADFSLLIGPDHPPEGGIEAKDSDSNRDVVNASLILPSATTKGNISIGTSDGLTFKKALRHFGLPTSILELPVINQFTDFQLDEASLDLAYPNGDVSKSLTVPNATLSFHDSKALWNFNDWIALTNIDMTFTQNGLSAAQTFSATLGADLQLGDTLVRVQGKYFKSGAQEKTWIFDASISSINLSDLTCLFIKSIGARSPDLPNLSFEDINLILNLSNGSFSFDGTVIFGRAVFKISADSNKDPKDLSKDIAVITANWDGKTSLNLTTLVNTLGLNLALPDIEITFEKARFSYSVTKKILKFDLTVSGMDAELIVFPNEGKSEALFKLTRQLPKPLGNLPVVGAVNLPINKLGLLYVSTSLPTAGDTFKQLGVTLPATMTTLNAGAEIIVELDPSVSKNPTSLTLAAKAPTKTSATPAPKPSLAPASPAEQKNPMPASKEGGSPAKWLSIQKTLGPLTLERMGLSYQDGRLWFLLDASVQLGALKLQLEGFALGFLMNTATLPELRLDGLGLGYTAPPLSLSGDFMRDSTVPKGTTRYRGSALFATKSITVEAVGAYEETNGSTSLFVFARAERPFGGPAFFYVTGFAGGFGYNQKIRIPDKDEVCDFPLVQGTSDPAALGGNTANLSGILSKLLTPNANKPAWLTAFPGQNWLAIGLDFSTFELITTRAVAIASFGKELEFALIGRSQMTLPKGAKREDAMAYVEMGLEAIVKPAEGFLGMTALISPNSYVLTKDCHLRGGFALYSWLSGEHAGDFVVTLGGYGPYFEKELAARPWYPRVPRLGLDWKVDEDTEIHGDCYFALTPSCVMAGGSLEAIYHSGKLRAWFTAHADFLMHWHPFFYEANVGVEVGVSYRMETIFGSGTIKASLGADVELWGPPTGGKAHVDFYVVSFTVPFGSDKPKEVLATDWTNFKPLLPPLEQPKTGEDPQKRKVALTHAQVEQGLLPTPTASEDLWIVRGDELRFTTVSAVPCLKVEWQQHKFGEEKNEDAALTIADISRGSSLYVKPMRAAVSESTHTVTISGPNKVAWHITPNQQNVPSALWGKPSPLGSQPQSVGETLIGGYYNGLTFKAPAPAEGYSPGTCDIRKALRYVSLGECSSPLQTATFEEAITVAPDTKKIIQNELATKAQSLRVSLVKHLQGLGLFSSTKAQKSPQLFAANAHTLLDEVHLQVQRP